MGPRLYRTRKDPLADVNDELRALFQEDPTITANSLLRMIQARHPKAYPANLLRTLQRRLTVWRTEMILTVEETWITEDELLTRSHSAALRAVMVSDAPIDDSNNYPEKEVDQRAD